MPSQEKREESSAAGQEGACDQCGRPGADMAWEQGLWLCAACREELGSCGCGD